MRRGLKHFIVSVAVLVAVCAIVLVVMHLLWPLPPLGTRSESAALTDTAGTPLGQGVAKLATGQADGLSGVHMLSDNRQAFATRVLLARAATRSLDVQYYIWKRDLAGILLLDELRKAADRGVRVRLLLDDNGIDGMDASLADIDQHPNIEVRLFNPFTFRDPRLLGYLTDPVRLNHRMHNKSFTADNQTTVVGGRNIGDEYFGSGEGSLFVDLDLIAIGPAVKDVSNDFDRYWKSQSAYPLSRMVAAAEDSGRVATAAAAARETQAGAAYTRAVAELPFVSQLIRGELPFYWAPVHMVSDDPAKALGTLEPQKGIVYGMRGILGQPKKWIDIVSAYFVPTEAGVDELRSFRSQGVGAQVLTNSFRASDVWIVHAGYAHWRKAMLRSGVQLFELRGDEAPTPKSLLGSGESGSGTVPRASGSTLHAKTVAVDRERIFVGSFNFDPRSANLNTELGFIVDSPNMARIIDDAFHTQIPAAAYELALAPDGDIVWKERRDGKIIVHETEPGTRWWQRAGIAFLGLLPIDWLL